MKLTPWFPATVKPVHPGWYETTCNSLGCNGMHYWTGNVWQQNTYGHWRGVKK